MPRGDRTNGAALLDELRQILNEQRQEGKTHFTLHTNARGTVLARHFHSARTGNANRTYVSKGVVSELQSLAAKGETFNGTLVPVPDREGRFKWNPEKIYSTSDDHANTLENEFNADYRAGRPPRLPKKARQRLINARPGVSGYIGQPEVNILESWGFGGRVLSTKKEGKFKCTSSAAQLTDSELGDLLKGHFAEDRNFPSSDSPAGLHLQHMLIDGSDALGAEAAEVLRKNGYGPYLVEHNGAIQLRIEMSQPIVSAAATNTYLPDGAMAPPTDNYSSQQHAHVAAVAYDASVVSRRKPRSL